MKLLSKIKHFVLGIFKDKRIPLRDKKVLIILTFLILSPLDFIPDWKPSIGLLDDLLFISFTLNYLFGVLDSQLTLSHFPWDMKAFTRIRAIGRFADLVVPRFVKTKVWKYEGDPY